MPSHIPGSAHPNIGLGILAIAGGAAGYIRKGSKASAFAGVGIGSLLLTSSYLITTRETPYEGHVLATVTTGIMAAAMGQRFLASGKFMPAGLVATLGVAGLAYNMNKALEWSASKSD